VCLKVTNQVSASQSDLHFDDCAPGSREGFAPSLPLQL
jgi:hypothetical protein